jgi:hypothetical protein
MDAYPSRGRGVEKSVKGRTQYAAAQNTHAAWLWLAIIAQARGFPFAMYLIAAQAGFTALNAKNILKI